MTDTENILLQQMRYIASISTGQAKRVADAALAQVSALEAQQVAVPEPLSDGISFTPSDMEKYLKPSAIKTIRAADLAIRYAKHKEKKP